MRPRGRHIRKKMCRKKHAIQTLKMAKDDGDDTIERNIVIYNNTSNQQHRNTVGLSAQPH